MLSKNIFFYYLLAFILSIQAEAPKVYKVIIDPGHGGIKQSPYEVYGDKYDSVSGKYLEFYKDGAKYNGITEMEVVLDLALELKSILDLTKTSKGFKKFRSYIKLFSNTSVEWIKLDSELTRTDSYKDYKFREKDDKNAKYRLYDYPDFATGKMKHGRISWINSKTPHLVVSLHINDLGSKNSAYGGMGVVISPSYRTFELLKSISEGRAPKEEFLNSPWNNWMIFQHKWSPLENAIADAWIYFHGYWTTKDGTKADLKRFEGYRQNMVTWKYRDNPGWERKVGKRGPYALKHENFQATGRFWEREKSQIEFRRREQGYEGFGGDNHYAGAELLRYVQYGLRIQANEFSDKYTSPNPIGKPYISTYSLPMLVNAISAYLELGNIRNTKDMYFLTKKKKKVAISLAVGIFSLFHGLEVKEKDYPYIPVGKRIEFETYVTKSGESYFEDVINFEEKNE